MSDRKFSDRRQFKTWNDAMVAKYDVEQFHNHPSPFVRYIERKRVRRIVEMLGAGAEASLVEIGCGAGHLLAEFPARRRFGVDIAETLLARAALRLGGPRGLVQGDAEGLPFRDGEWDRIYCSEVLEHVPSPEAALGEMSRIVARDGVIVVSVPNERLINAFKSALRRLRLSRLVMRTRIGDYSMPERMDDEWHLHTFDLRMLVKLIPPRLRITQIEGVPFRWLPLRYVVRCEVFDAGQCK